MTSRPRKQDLSALEKAITSLTQLHERVADEEFMSSLDDVIRLGLQAGLIQNLEFTYELCWKAMKRWLEDNVNPNIVDGVSRREFFRIAAENLLIEDVDEWMKYHEARNRTSHEYDSAIPEEVLTVIADFARAAQNVLNELRKRND